MLTVMNIVGARPQFVKYAPVSRALADRGTGDILVHTGQHYDDAMSKIFFDQFGIREPDHHLGVGSGSHGVQTGLMLARIEAVITTDRPDAVIVYGDTNTTLAAALAAAKLHIPIAHVESGLRSFNRHMPEEINRILTDHVSSCLLCPCETAVRQLEREGFATVIADGALLTDADIAAIPPGGNDPVASPVVANVGDVMYDVLLSVRDIAARTSAISRDLGLEDAPYHLLTIHRAENTDDPERFRELVGFVNEASNGIRTIFPMHPRTQSAYAACGAVFADTVRIIEPVGYFDMVRLMAGATTLFTDSGGMQKEAYWLGVPCVTLRDETEWTETVDAGWNILFRDYTGSHDSPKSVADAYGDGHAASRIARLIEARIEARPAHREPSR